MANARIRSGKRAVRFNQNHGAGGKFASGEDIGATTPAPANGGPGWTGGQTAHFDNQHDPWGHGAAQVPADGAVVQGKHIPPVKHGPIPPPTARPLPRVGQLLEITHPDGKVEKVRYVKGMVLPENYVVLRFNENHGEDGKFATGSSSLDAQLNREQPWNQNFMPPMPADFKHRLGQCYVLSGGEIINDPKAKELVHGTIQGDGNDPIGHAWVVNNDGSIHEPASDRDYTQKSFDRLFNDVPEKTYSASDASKIMLETGHYGPWTEDETKDALRFNQNHGEGGRFSTGDDGVTMVATPTVVQWADAKFPKQDRYEKDKAGVAFRIVPEQAMADINATGMIEPHFEGMGRQQPGLYVTTDADQLDEYGSPTDTVLALHIDPADGVYSGGIPGVYRLEGALPADRIVGKFTGALRYNENHDASGKFTTGDGESPHAVGVSDDPNSQSLKTLTGPRQPGETLQQYNDRLFREGLEHYRPEKAIEEEAKEIREEKGLPEPDITDWTAIEAPEDRLEAVGKAFAELQSDPDNPQVRAAYDDLKRQVDEQWESLTGPVEEGGLGVRVDFVSPDEIRSLYGDSEGLNPYSSAGAQCEDLRENHHLAIASIADYPEAYHPYLSNTRGGEYDTFRAVHDAFGHAAIGADFTRHGEFEAWMHHSSMFTGLGRLAASTELTGENSFLVTTHEPAEHKAGLLPYNLIALPFDSTGEYNPDFYRMVLAQLIFRAQQGRMLGGEAEIVQKFGVVNPHDALFGKITRDRKRAALHSGKRRLRYNHEHGAGGLFAVGEDKATLEAMKSGVDVNQDRPEVGAVLKREFQDKDVVNLAHLGVEGTYIFRGDSDTPREGMPQIPNAERQEFVDALATQGWDATHIEMIPVDDLRPTQSEINGVKATGIAHAIDTGEFNPLKDPIFVTEDNHILDGHHRWAGQEVRQLETGEAQYMKATVISANINDVLAFANQYDIAQGIGHQGFNTGPANPADMGGRSVRYNHSHDELGKFSDGDVGVDVTMPSTVAGFTPLPAASVYTDTGKAELEQWKRDNGPHAVEYAGMMADWTDVGSAQMSRAAMNGSSEEGRRLASFMDEAPRISGTLYRGTSAVDLEPGFKFTIGPSSFSRNEETGDSYATRVSHPTVIEVENARGLPVDGLSKYPEEHEVISGGTFTVISSTHEDVATFGDPMSIQHLVVRQEPDTSVRARVSWWKPTRPLTAAEEAMTGTFADERPRLHSGKRALRYNQNHDAGGRFSEGDGGTSASLTMMNKVTFTGEGRSIMLGTTPEAQAYVDLANHWTTSSESADEIARVAAGKDTTVLDVKLPGMDYTGAEQYRQDGATLKDLMDNAPEISGAVFRGAQVPESWTRGDARGKEVSLGLSSFSKDDQVAAPYAFRTAAEIGAEHAAVLRVAMDTDTGTKARGVPIGDLSNFPSEKEYITGGKFTIANVSTYSIRNLEEPSGGGAAAMEQGIRAVSYITLVPR